MTRGDARCCGGLAADAGELRPGELRPGELSTSSGRKTAPRGLYVWDCSATAVSHKYIRASCYPHWISPHFPVAQWPWLLCPLAVS
jgi:hypothetical protein